MIQGTLRYVMKRGQDKEEVEGAIFAAAVLPKIHAACEFIDARFLAPV